MNIYYTISNNGDGSVSAHFYESYELAELAEEWEFEAFGDGWAESSIGCFEGSCDRLILAKRVLEDMEAELTCYDNEDPKYDNLARIASKVKELT